MTSATPAIDARRLLRDRGWAVLRGVVGAPELAALREAFDRALGGPLPPVAQRPGAHESDPALRAWVRDGRLGDLGRRLLDAEEVRLLQDALIAKPPRTGGEVAWHQDASYLGYLPADRVVSLRLALGRETLEDGGLEVLDGSHRWPEPAASRVGAEEVEDALDRLDPAHRARVAELRRAVVLEPGDVSVHGPRTWHRSAPNRGPALRRTVVTHVFDATSVVDPSRIAANLAPHFPRDAAGRLTGPTFPRLG